MSKGLADLQMSASIGVAWRIRIWVRSLRLQFLPQGVLPVILGSVVAWTERGTLDAGFFVLALVGSACVQVGLTMLNDALDFVYGADCSTSMDKNPFSGGSGVLTDGHLQPKEMLIAVAMFYLAAAVIGAYLTLRVGPGVFVLALLGLFLSVFYSVKPVRLAYRGLGELALLLGYGPTITLGAAYVQTGRFSLAAGLAGLVPGLLMWSMILVNEIPDYLEDLRANKQNLTVRLGPARARWLYLGSLLAAYVFAVAGAAAGAFPVWSMLVLGSMPFAWRSFRVVQRHYRDPQAMAPANLAMVMTYSSAMLLFCTGFWLSKVL